MHGDSLRPAVDVRGAAPGSRELDLLQPGMRVRRPDAILLTGGSAFGLAAADGVMRWLRQQGRGFPTSEGPVPIVPAAVVFDRSVGSEDWPGPDAGYAATRGARPLDQLETGRVGAGAGTRIGRLGGPRDPRDGACVAAQIRLDDGMVTAIAIANPYGTLIGTNGPDPRIAALAGSPPAAPEGEATTLMACVTDLSLDHDALIRMTVAMHDGLARMVAPAHTLADGDVAFASTTREVATADAETSLRASVAAELAIEAAIGTLLESARLRSRL